MIPDPRELREARERFAALLAGPKVKEVVWQRFFAECPFVLSNSLPIKLLPQDIVPLGRPGKSEPDLFFYPRHRPLTHSSYGVIELKRHDDKVLTRPRKDVVILTRNAETAVAQAQTYLSQIENRKLLRPREDVLFLGTSAYVFILMGMTTEFERLIVSEMIEGQLKFLLPPNFQLIPYDRLFQMFAATVPPLCMIAVPDEESQLIKSSKVASIIFAAGKGTRL